MSRKSGNLQVASADAAHLLLAKNLLTAGHHEEALAEVSKVVAHSPTLAMGHFLHGMLLAQVARIDDALAELEVAVELDAKLFNAWLMLAFLRFDCGHYGAAQVAVGRALLLDPGHSRARMLSALVEDKLQNLDGAIADCQAALDSDPGFELARLRLANWLARRGQTAEATESAILALRLNLVDLQARLCLAEMLSQVGRSDEAVAECQSAIELFPGKPQPWLALGSIHQRHGDSNAAILAWQKSLDISPGQIEAHMRLGEVYLQRRQREEAIAAFEAALTIEATFAEAHHYLAQAQALAP